MQLNLGCGRDIDPSFINADARDLPGVDMIWDLDRAPWPWVTGGVHFIRAFDIFEHVSDPVIFMNECYRILPPGGTLHVRTNHWKQENAYTDPTHKRFCTEHTFDFWIPGTDLHDKGGADYGPARFSLQQHWMSDQEQHFLLVALP